MKTIASFAASCLFLSMFVACGVLAAERELSGRPTVQGTATAGVEIRASRVIGRTLTNVQGEQLGRVADIIISSDGCVEYVILEPTGFSGAGRILIPIPWTIVRTERDIIVVVIDRARLVKAPFFERGRRVDFRGNEWKTRVNDYFRGQTGVTGPETGRPGEKKEITSPKVSLGRRGVLCSQVKSQV